ncbi:uncharacterized protein B0H18DRAFT_983822 [Fomitopsis serialis]|uniref:uncharacterized protein n=1 Tax=Fomitopsis serialis TaxID=139415 RepID=UPI002007EDF8|nr:uncharacterized protein B0H18DRAFT_983822 [Neoantrodia serialis]KAH9933462.1 hypothetical protein B0H18DRAFT_983822 [Neoantrodia serialis]
MIGLLLLGFYCDPGQPPESGPEYESRELEGISIPFDVNVVASEDHADIPQVVRDSRTALLRTLHRTVAG